jgi:charged multivesicular body protein 6
MRKRGLIKRCACPALSHVAGMLIYKRQEISELLANKMSNQDEDEVEDELDALEAEVNGVVPALPDAPVAQPQFTPEEKAQMAKDRAARRARERAAEQASQPMLA